MASVRIGNTLQVVAAVVALLLAVAALAWGFQRRLIYLPYGSPDVLAGAVLDRGVDVRLHTEDGLDLTAWWAPATGSARGDTVLVAPGNAGSRVLRVPLARGLAAAGFDVLLVEYRGYGGNPGSPTEEGLAADARAAYQVPRRGTRRRPGTAGAVRGESWRRGVDAAGDRAARGWSGIAQPVHFAR